jgi:hypothetical protein
MEGKIVNEPQELHGQDASDAERVRLEDKKDCLAMALEERIKQHRFEREKCDLRIEACRVKLSKPGAMKAELEKTIASWERIRQYHIDVRRLSEKMLREIST